MNTGATTERLNDKIVMRPEKPRLERAQETPAIGPAGTHAGRGASNREQ